MIHLHVRSWYSFLKGASSPTGLVQAAAADGHAAIALTDLNTVAGVVQFARACKDAGIKPIFGAEVTVDGHPLVLICSDREAYANLCDLLTLAHCDRLNPGLRLRQLVDRTTGLICLTGDRWGYLSGMLRQKNFARAQEYVAQLQKLFPRRLFIELVNHRRPGDTTLIRWLTELAEATALPVVATNAVRHATPAEYALHDALLCAGLGIGIGDRHPQRPVNNQAYLRSKKEMFELGFPAQPLANTSSIADLCNMDFLSDGVTPPAAQIPQGTDAKEYLKQLCRQGLKVKYPSNHPLRSQAITTLRKEVGIICALELEEFFIVVREVVQYARSCGIRCSGRGSAANSIVAYLLGITGVDPIAHHLLFERFLHMGRKGTPDIDVDFPTHRRSEVIEWMSRRFGEAQTAMTANLNTYRVRSAVRDMAKVLGFPLASIDQCTKLLPGHSTRSIREYRSDMVEALGESPLMESLLCLVELLDDCPRHLSLHSGGMVLSRRPLRYFSPIQSSANTVRQVQFNKDDVESLGLIKFDVLGLRTLSVVTETEELLLDSQGTVPNLDALPLDDEKTFELIRSGKTMCVFQIESPGQWNLLSKSQPMVFDDLVAQVALFRPGPLQGNMVHPYILRRRGLQEVESPHPSLDLVLHDTHGLILYQEQVLEVAHQFAGLSLSQADEFRRLMSKFRSSNEMEGMREQFVHGAVKLHGVSNQLANEVFDTVSKFVGYGFCRSHAAAFALIVYITAYLKAHHPAAYMAAVLEHKPGFYPMHSVLEEARLCGVPVLPVDVTRSGIKYSLEDGAIRVSLTQVQQVSPEDAATIVLERAIRPFDNLEDIYRRVRMDRDAWEALARAGAFDGFGARRKVLWELGTLVRRLGTSGYEQTALDAAAFRDDTPALDELTLSQLISWDFATQELTTGPHPLAPHRHNIEKLGGVPIAQLDNMAPGTQVLMAGVVISRQRPPTAKGMTFLILEDETGRLPTALIPPLYENFKRELREPGLLIQGKLEGSGPGQIGMYRSVLIHRMWPLERLVGLQDGGYRSHPGQGAR